MLSILIPVLNTSITELVRGLNEQGQRVAVPFEIIILDDASESTYLQQNAVLDNLESVSYHSLEKNLGRAGARNKLAQLANFQYLLFIDADAGIIHDQFLNNYIPYLKDGVILCGGTAYDQTPPVDKKLYFRWKYGIKRESKTASKRNKEPNAGFSSFNFLIDKDLFMSIGFEEQLNQYGHEDTLFGYELLKRNERILHINNPLLHLGLEPAGLFIEKTRNGLKNLHCLTQEYNEAKDFIKLVRLLRLFYRLRKMNIVPFPKRLSNSILSKTENKLKGSRPNLLFFDLYKLLYYSCLYFSPPSA